MPMVNYLSRVGAESNSLMVHHWRPVGAVDDVGGSSLEPSRSHRGCQW